MRRVPKHPSATPAVALVPLVLASIQVALAEPEESPPERRAEAAGEALLPDKRLADEAVRRAEPTGRATSILSARVLDSEGNWAGTIADLLLDLPSARLGPVVVAPAGSLETPGELSAVPPSAFQRQPTGEFRLGIDREAFAAAPRFQADKWPDLRDETYLGSLYRAYRVEPYFRTDAWQDGTTGNLELGVTGNTDAADLAEADRPGTRTGPVRRATRIIGLPVRNPAGDRLGKVHDLIVDFPAERIVAVAVTVESLSGGESRTALVAPAAFSLPAAADELRLDMSRDGLAGAPRLREETVESDPPAPAVQAVREALERLEGLSEAARALVVSEEEGRVIVAGTVASEEEKERILQIARRHAAPGEIENQLVVGKPSGGVSE